MLKLHWIILLGCLYSTSISLAQTPTAVKAGKLMRHDFFKDDGMVTITLETDYRKMQSAKVKGVYQPATVTLQLPDSAAIKEEIQVFARGEFRRENCAMPGIMMNFKTPTSPKLSSLKKMKLVCGCGASVYQQQLLLTEYLIYRMYNMLTDLSFKTKLAKVVYKDERNKMKEYTQYAFFIEDVDDMAARNECKEDSKTMYLTEQTNRDVMTMVGMFQFMIGNTDWSVPNFHNVKLIKPIKDSFAMPYVVPYDFDFAGLVNAPYALPNEALGIEKVTDRLYRGFARTSEELDKMAAVFNEKKQAFTDLLRNFDLIDKGDREVMVKYMNDFYTIINNKRKLQDAFINNARKQ
ncbi:MAG: hypothetical protein ABIN57_04565 [Chitinophagaceae bacterium]